MQADDIKRDETPDQIKRQYPSVNRLVRDLRNDGNNAPLYILDAFNIAQSQHELEEFLK